MGDLPGPALILNAKRLNCPGSHLVSRLTRPGSKEERRELEQSLGKRLWNEQGFCFDIAPGSSSDTESLNCIDHPVIHLAALRDGVSARLADLGMNPRFRFAGEISCVDPNSSQGVDASVVIGDEFKMRVTKTRDSNLLLIRQRSTWVSKATVADLDLSKMGDGIYATRLRGDGPRRGTIIQIEGEKLLLANRSEQVRVNAEDYAAILTVPTIVRGFGTSTLRKVQVASGHLASNGQRNRYIVKRRFEKCRDVFIKLGKELRLPDGGKALIADAWAGIELQ